MEAAQPRSVLVCVSECPQRQAGSSGHAKSGARRPLQSDQGSADGSPRGTDRRKHITCARVDVESDRKRFKMRHSTSVRMVPRVRSVRGMLRGMGL